MLNIGESITLGTAHGASAAGTYSACVAAAIIDRTDKAVKLEALAGASGKTYSAWFPAKALTITKTNDDGGHICHSAKLAGWFKPKDWTAQFLSMCQG